MELIPKANSIVESVGMADQRVSVGAGFALQLRHHNTTMIVGYHIISYSTVFAGLYISEVSGICSCRLLHHIRNLSNLGTVQNHHVSPMCHPCGRAT